MRFPFGAPVRPLVQRPLRNAKVFVLGVYASAVHARWFNDRGKLLVRALAVASEPEIFWRGDDAESMVSAIHVPAAAGYLLAAASQFNGPSGQTLDSAFLRPLGVERDASWLCDLLPESRANPAQLAAIATKYAPLALELGLPLATVGPVPKVFADTRRQREILAELMDSNAGILVTLGDYPLRDFLAPLQVGHSRLSAYGTSSAEYGRPHEIAIAGRPITHIPLVHPRQAGRLGQSSSVWSALHSEWVRRHILSHAGGRRSEPPQIKSEPQLTTASSPVVSLRADINNSLLMIAPERSTELSALMRGV